MASSMAEELHHALKKVEEEIGFEEIAPIEKEIQKFCEIIDDNNPAYFTEGIFPPGYVMNLTNRVIQKVFIKIGPLFMGKNSKIKGLIHVGSVVEFLKPMPLNKKYKIKIETSEPKEKTGKKGTYYAVVFKTIIVDENDAIYALDYHDFFFKL